MLAKRIIPCLDVLNGKVVKGVQFKSHEIIGDIIPLVIRYLKEGADELVFYDISASVCNTLVEKKWISKIAEIIDIPFCVAGGIKNLKDVQAILSFGADKISINSPAIENPSLISRIADRFGSQCLVVGIDSWFDRISNKYKVYQFTGSNKRIKETNLDVFDWVNQVQLLGAGEIVLNVMNSDGLRKGYDLIQLSKVREFCKIPLVASGGAGSIFDFYNVFKISKVDGALAASVFHKKLLNINTLKKTLSELGLEIRK
ncbi:Imidazole glycerol phosphate synthase subunit HisF [Buchnera aphidicola (Tetraneura ulmi)]|uniref:imidazole glycerol phosphate synthase subunit HisF n=1 Tax=Buchnera aphidicola TaxID=9 RepID=UPI003463FB83